MGIDRLILTCISIVVIVFFVVVAVEFAIPITKNQIFNEECRTYLLKMERNGGYLAVSYTHLTLPTIYSV